MRTGIDSTILTENQAVVHGRLFGERQGTGAGTCGVEPTHEKEFVPVNPFGGMNRRLGSAGLI